MAEIDAALAAMQSLGEAWRGAWADFDGRTLRLQLEELATLTRKAARGESVKGDVAAFYAVNNICPQCHSWTEYCNCQREETKR